MLRSNKQICHQLNCFDMYLIFSAYIENFDHDVNIIGVDWSELSAHNGLPNYFIAASNSIKVGEHTGHLFAKMLIESLGVNANSIHAIGHSLGAHLVGHFGRAIQSDVNEKIIRITGRRK